MRSLYNLNALFLFWPSKMRRFLCIIFITLPKYVIYKFDIMVGPPIIFFVATGHR